MSSMNKSEYRYARRLYRDNGCTALNWLPHDQAMVMDQLLDRLNAVDPLEERADIYRTFRKVGINCNVRHTQAIRH